MSYDYPWDETEIRKAIASLSKQTHNTTYFCAILKICSCTPSLLLQDKTASVIGAALKDVCGGLIFYRLYRVPDGPAACFLLMKPRTQDQNRSYIRVFLTGLQLKLKEEYGIITTAALSRALTRACPFEGPLVHLKEMTDALNLFTLDGQPHIIKDYPKDKPFTLPVYAPALSCTDREEYGEFSQLVNEALDTVRVRRHLTLGESVLWIDTVIRFVNRQLSAWDLTASLIPDKGSLRDKWYNYSTFEEFYMQNRSLLAYPKKLRESMEFGY